MDGTSLTSEQQKLNALKQVLPEVFVEGKIDWEKLKATLGENINFSNERYVLNWAGKSDAFKVLQIPTTKTLIPAKEESVNFDNTENIFIEGENLEVLKVLQKSYFGKVKMIYIDPPYNTGSDSFIYPDKFSESKADYEKRVGDKDEEGYMTKDGMFKKNSKENGQYHSNWLNMMMPRLFLAKNLLRQDGVIFVSIDDNEVHNLKLLLNEIFGEENFINQVAVNMKNVAGASGGGEDIRLKKNIEHLLIYTKNYSEIRPFNSAYDFIPVHELVEKYKEEDISWKYTAVLIDEGKKEFLSKTVDGDGNDINIYKRINPVFKSISQIIREEKITEQEAYKKYAKKIFQTAMPQSSIRPRVMKKVNELGIVHDFFSIEYVPKSGRNKGILYEQFYKGDNFRLLAWLSDVSEEIDGVLYKKELKGTYWDFASETKNLTKEGGIPYPNGKKPLAMLKRIVQMATTLNESDIVLDFFAGSGTTAHAVIELNKDDGGNRKFINIQLDELIDDIDKVETYNAIEFTKLKTVADILKTRLSNVNKRIGAEIKQKETDKKAKLSFDNNEIEINLDLGYKVLKLEDSNFKQWQQIEGKDAKALAEQMKLFVDPVSESATIENMVYEILLKSGKDLNSSIEKKGSYYKINNTEMILLLEKATQEIIDAVIDVKPIKVIALDKLFKGNDQLKTNTVLQMKDAGIEFKTI
jgi:adenine-specific DNA-methyltransferase